MRRTTICLAIWAILPPVYAFNDQSQQANECCDVFVQHADGENVTMNCGVDPKVHQQTQKEKSELEKKLFDLYEQRIKYLEERNELLDKAKIAEEVMNNYNELRKAYENLQARVAEAEKYYQETLKNYRDLADKQPAVYLPYVALTLNNLANLLQSDTNRRAEAEQYYQEALKIRRDLADK
ncbi:tetratricopeptide repeat protein [Beggiatoa leptomitoformis]|uniref:Tetratricopeptide repeat protein n=1 Tax=Beggiatoa leptomitoformis TaxID=288004 RepID=A0A2N9YDC5_9GAMM|nr:tetratricopeptide repeat protein [Beggiatoa leptomitoformis]ALG69085.1 tetratricopeptide repeat protein [Beggiatoa leptomitoformis]AUI68503.1 tetratricopeptide repeat protein [Beggiatoa leptomitoformis]